MTYSGKMPPQTTQERLQGVLARIEAAAREAGRDPASVQLVAVTKTFGVQDILPVMQDGLPILPDSLRIPPNSLPTVQGGHRVFGENRVQEAKAKWPPLRERFHDLELHLIGPLQSNKAREAVALFDVIQTVDRPKIADALAEEMARAERRLKLFIQVNTGDEAQKAGVSVGEAAGLLRHCQDRLGLAIEGLMCIPPFDGDPAPHFALLARLAADLGLGKLSMGMSGDFETAIRHGATHVRVGSAIFGARE